jgi:hypothetical protein
MFEVAEAYEDRMGRSYQWFLRHPKSSRKGHSLGSGPTRWLPQAPGGLVTRRISFVSSEHLECGQARVEPCDGRKRRLRKAAFAIAKLESHTRICTLRSRISNERLRRIDADDLQGPHDSG